MTASPLPDPVALAVSFTTTLERIGIVHLVGGSLASSVHGEPRSTNDIDVLADIGVGHVQTLVDTLEADYAVSEDAVNEAIVAGSFFNAIHVAAAIKIDVFVAGDDAFNLERLRCRQLSAVTDDPPTAIYVDTAEHSILRKLEWYRRGGEISDRQWRDVVAMLRIQAERLDRTRLDRWANWLRVTDLLERAVAEAR